LQSPSSSDRNRLGGMAGELPDHSVISQLPHFAMDFALISPDCNPPSAPSLWRQPRIWVIRPQLPRLRIVVWTWFLHCFCQIGLQRYRIAVVNWLFYLGLSVDFRKFPSQILVSDPVRVESVFLFVRLDSDLPVRILLRHCQIVDLISALNAHLYSLNSM
jgi:hypothetical protein